VNKRRWHLFWRRVRALIPSKRRSQALQDFDLHVDHMNAQRMAIVSPYKMRALWARALVLYSRLDEYESRDLTRVNQIRHEMQIRLIQHFEEQRKREFIYSRRGELG